MEIFWKCQYCQNRNCSFNGKAHFRTNCTQYEKAPMKHWRFSPIQLKTSIRPMMRAKEGVKTI